MLWCFPEYDVDEFSELWAANRESEYIFCFIFLFAFYASRRSLFFLYNFFIKFFSFVILFAINTLAFYMNALSNRINHNFDLSPNFVLLSYTYNLPTILHRMPPHPPPSPVCHHNLLAYSTFPLPNFARAPMCKMAATNKYVTMLAASTTNYKLQL